MGFFFKALAAMVTADAIDRHARARRTTYWYPTQPGMPPMGNHVPSVATDPAETLAIAYPPPAGGWDPNHPERPH